jgi:hypothetical protein
MILSLYPLVGSSNGSIRAPFSHVTLVIFVRATRNCVITRYSAVIDAIHDSTRYLIGVSS